MEAMVGATVRVLTAQMDRTLRIGKVVAIDSVKGVRVYGNSKNGGCVWFPLVRVLPLKSQVN